MGRIQEIKEVTTAVDLPWSYLIFAEQKLYGDSWLGLAREPTATDYFVTNLSNILQLEQRSTHGWQPEIVLWKSRLW